MIISNLCSEIQVIAIIVKYAQDSSMKIWKLQNKILLEDKYRMVNVTQCTYPGLRGFTG